MIQLDDNRWQDFKGGYRMPYNASVDFLYAVQLRHHLHAVVRVL
jgi:hypothetical protein